MTKVKVRFKETRIVDDNRKGTKDEEKYVEGKTYNLRPDQAERWIRRGVAETVAGKAKAAPKPKKDADDEDGDDTAIGDGTDTETGDGDDMGNGDGDDTETGTDKTSES